MKPITFTGGGMLAGLANMLELLGYDVEDREIAIGMQAPYLIVHDHEGYKAGSSLYCPQWMNLYLHPRGFHLEEVCVAKEEAAAYLRAHAPAMLNMKINKYVTHPVVFSEYGQGRYCFVNIKSRTSAEPDIISVTAASLKSRLEENLIVYTLTRCESQPTDFLPLLTASLDNLEEYLTDLLAARQRMMTKAEFTALHEPLFRPLMRDLQPMMALIGDDILAEELRLLNHDYRHVFTLQSPEYTALYEHLPKGSMIQCITWLRENILDRLYDLGASDAVLEQKAVFPKRKKRG